MHLRRKIVFSGDVEKDVYYKTKRLEPQFEESITERTKIRRQKKSDDRHLETKNIPDLESEESPEQRRK